MKRQTRVPGGFILLLGVVLLSAAALGPGGRAAEPVGAKIAAIDVKTGTVTAKETATGRAFQFQVKGAELLNSLKVGQTISADLKAMNVTLQLGSNKLKIKDGYAFKRTSQSAGVVAQAIGSGGGIGGGIDVDCVCQFGTQPAETCEMRIQGPLLICENGTCTGQCNVQAKIPGVKMARPSLR